LVRKPSDSADALLELRTAPERRRGVPDRRQRKTPVFSRYTFIGGKRRGGRRKSENNGIYVDRYGTGIFMLFLSILVLNVLDAYFTLVFIQLGGNEANPIAQVFLDMGVIPFLLVKSVAIGICLLVLVLHKTFYSVPRVLFCICVFYSLLLVYHIVLQLMVIPTLQ